MRVKISTNPPLPPVKAWFPLNISTTPTISSFKSILCTSLPAFHGVNPSSLHLSIDDFELLDDFELTIVRDGDLICVDSLDVPSMNATVQHQPVIGPSVSQAAQTPLAPATSHERCASPSESSRETESGASLTSGSSSKMENATAQHQLVIDPSVLQVAQTRSAPATSHERYASPSESSREIESGPSLTSGSSSEMENLSTSTQFHSIRNIVVVGETGVGKSSLINLVTGIESAITGNRVIGITTEVKCHNWNADSTHKFRLWDTPGLSEGSFGSVPPEKALDELRSLFTKLKESGGVHLVVHCMHGYRVTGGMKKIYEDITVVRDNVVPGVPLVAVITELEKISRGPDIIASMEQWWKENDVALSSFNMLFSGHACITTLQDGCIPELPTRRGLCQDLVRRLIIQASLVLNVVIAGEIGSGKSSLVNLVLGSGQATVVHDLRNDANTTDDYDLKFDNQVIRLWDTPGLQGNESHGHAEKVLRSLFGNLNKRGGTHLLIICIPRILKAKETKKVYESLMQMRKSFCSATPVFAVITGLEDLAAEPDLIASMEKWWEDNLATLSALKMFFPGHACITTLSDESNSKRHKLCQQLVHNLIVKGVSLRNVVVAGEIGAAKSSLINLVLDSEQTITAHELTACTKATSPFDVGIDNQLIRLWDTPGFGNAEGAQKALRSLFTDLWKNGGVHLLVVCVNSLSNIMATRKIYDGIMRLRKLFCPDTPVVLVISGLEEMSARPDVIASMEEWWQVHMPSGFDGVSESSAHACITTLPDSSPPEMPGRREACRRLVHNLIINHSLPVVV